MNMEKTSRQHTWYPPGTNVVGDRQQPYYPKSPRRIDSRCLKEYAMLKLNEDPNALSLSSIDKDKLETDTKLKSPSKDLKSKESPRKESKPRESHRRDSVKKDMARLESRMKESPRKESRHKETSQKESRHNESSQKESRHNESSQKESRNKGTSQMGSGSAHRALRHLESPLKDQKKEKDKHDESKRPKHTRTGSCDSVFNEKNKESHKDGHHETKHRRQKSQNDVLKERNKDKHKEDKPEKKKKSEEKVKSQRRRSSSRKKDLCKDEEVSNFLAMLESSTVIDALQCPVNASLDGSSPSCTASNDPIGEKTIKKKDLKSRKDKLIEVPCRKLVSDEGSKENNQDGQAGKSIESDTSTDSDNSDDDTTMNYLRPKSNRTSTSQVKKDDDNGVVRSRIKSLEASKKEKSSKTKKSKEHLKDRTVAKITKHLERKNEEYNDNESIAEKSEMTDVSTRARRASIAVWREQTKSKNETEFDSIRSPRSIKHDKKPKQEDASEAMDAEVKRNEDRKKLLDSSRKGPVRALSRRHSCHGEETEMMIANLPLESELTLLNQGKGGFVENGYLPRGLGHKADESSSSVESSEIEVVEPPMRRRPTLCAADFTSDFVDRADRSESQLHQVEHLGNSYTTNNHVPSQRGGGGTHCPYETPSNSSLHTSFSTPCTTKSDVRKLNIKLETKTTKSPSKESTPGRRSSVKLEGDAVENILKSRRLRGDSLVPVRARPKEEKKTKEKKFLFL